MFVYIHWTKTGCDVVQAFHKIDKAADFIISSIEGKIGSNFNWEYKTKKKLRNVAYAAQPILFDAPAGQNQIGQVVPVAAEMNPAAYPAIDLSLDKKEEIPIIPELVSLKEQCDLTRKTKTLENISKVIDLYEDYITYVKSYKSIIHEIQEIKIVE